MTKIFDIIKGFFIGIANVVPGVSGGTLAIILKIYDKLINAVNDLFSTPIKAIKSVFFIGIGIVLGIILSVFGVTYFYDNFPIPTAFLFMGFIFGGLPVITKEINFKKINILKILLFIGFLLLTVSLPYISGTNKSINEFSMFNMIILLFLGVIASATMIIPGVSGSMVLMCFGYYDSIMNLIKNCISSFLAFNVKDCFHYGLLILPFAIGVGLGIILIAKLIKYLLNNYRELTFIAILGLILASPFGILYQIESFDIKILEWLITGVLFIFGLLTPYFLEEKLSKKFKSK